MSPKPQDLVIDVEENKSSKDINVVDVENEKKKDRKIINKPLPFHKLLSYADAVDWSLMPLGTSGSIIHGTAQPIGDLLLGKALNAFGSNIGDDAAMVKALDNVIPFVWYMGIATFQLEYWAIVPMILVIGATYTKKMNTVSTVKLLYLSEATSMVEQTVSQIKTVFAFVGESYAIKTFSESMAKQLSKSKVEALIKGVVIGTFQTVTFCSWALIIWVAAVVVTAKRAHGGDVLAAIMSILLGAISLTFAAPDMQIFNQTKAAGNEVFEVIQRKPLITNDSKGKTLDRMDGNIDIRDVHFAYPSRQDALILKGFSLSIPSGKMVALVGSSGCGKNTVISLIAIGSTIPPKDLDLKFLRRNVGAVSQEPSLFAGTIKDNLIVGNMGADDQEVENAAMMANAHPFISQLPNQYSTEVGQRGFQLSGGQKQRIAIARAILKNPPILLLDEATSALDSESEKLVQDALEKAMQGRTVILIAHRMSTMIHADMIAIVENGQVIETGTHRSLLETSKVYGKLFSMQNISTANNSSLKNQQVPTNSFYLQTLINTRNVENPTSTFANLPCKRTRKEGRKEASPFFRIWFGLEHKDLVKTVIGSVAAAFSGISKPFFGYFIITVGVTYYKEDANRRVGWFSIMFALIGLLSLFTHTLQHYLFGAGEKAMANLRQALYSGISSVNQYHYKEDANRRVGWFSIMFALIGLLSLFTHTLQHYLFGAGEKAMANLRQALYSGVLLNELAWFEKPENTVGSLTSRIIHDTSKVKIIISDRMSVIVQCLSSILIATIVSMVVNWRMGLVAWAVMPCHFIGGLIQAKSAKGFSGDSAAAHYELVELASESTANIRTIVSFCHEEQILKKAKICLENPKRRSRKESIKYGLLQGVFLCLWNIAHAVALWYATHLVDKHQATFLDGIRSYQIFSLTVPSITELWTLIPTVISAIGVLAPAFETLDRETEIQPDIPKSPDLETIVGRIEFQNIQFNYPLRPEVTVLHNFSLQIEAGLKVALVGPSGSGKSSVLALLLRFYDPREGRLLIDKKDTREYNLRKLRRQIGWVQQEPIRFSSSIRDNIIYRNEGASETEIVKVSREANIQEFVSNFPDGNDTVVGEKGCQLSGGQKQRIAIARTLLKRPAILLLDEATSALDTETERSIVSALGSVKLNDNRGSGYTTTQITVAHRISTVKNSDTIVVMDKGEIAQMGSHSALIATSDGLYSRLHQLQN
ncbi:hypothetical protein NC653_034109 [Populus alba x Populus x berolinensis]|uniref:Uncharacterized protein n=1 Tax=Populus alba x Populus x berolinensis TaxID=444605 RepID=A0AAD6LM10_9ROSI|nr:hypothetical protein NC653_034109 [Populus alba x Populus x berolinensis]